MRGKRQHEDIWYPLLTSGVSFALNGRKGNRIYAKKADGDFEAHLVALSCSEPPEGFVRWSLRLLADKVVELDYIGSISHEAVRRILKKNEIKPWQHKGWVIPPEQNGSFVANMEMVLTFTSVLLIQYIRLYAWTNPQSS